MNKSMNGKVTVSTLESIGSNFVYSTKAIKNVSKLSSANIGTDKKAIVHFDRIVTIKDGTRIATSSSSFTHSKLSLLDGSIMVNDIPVDKISGFVFLKDSAISTLEESIGKCTITLHFGLVVSITGNNSIKTALNSLFGKELIFIKNR